MTVPECLDEAIEHWERLAGGTRLPSEDVGALHCPLCEQLGCEHCPVAEFTGAPSCNLGPYSDAALARKRFGLDSPQFLEAAKEELIFLKRIRDCLQITTGRQKY